MSRIDSLKEYYSNIPEVKRIKELEHYIDTNKEINDTLKAIKDKQKQMVNAKEFNLTNQYNTYKLEYDELKNHLFDLPFVEEYLELLDIVNQMLNETTNEIEIKINKLINN